MFHHISKHQEESRKRDVQQSTYDELQGVWKCGQTLSRVFDIYYSIETETKEKWERNKIKKISCILIKIRYLNAATVIIFFV